MSKSYTTVTALLAIFGVPPVRAGSETITVFTMKKWLCA
ncbi:hypothetical protein SALWKB2_1974 [Snodgrassella alvi wkB2]|nr:hypothetical protein SALWKB2_1974 [Snodgrassella alvi wkB2]